MRNTRIINLITYHARRITQVTFPYQFDDCHTSQKSYGRVRPVNNSVVFFLNYPTFNINEISVNNNLYFGLQVSIWWYDDAIYIDRYLIWS